MARWQTQTRLPELVELIGLPFSSGLNDRLAVLFLGPPVAASQRWVGAPARNSRRLTFPHGIDVFVSDDVIVGVRLELQSSLERPTVELADWIPGVDNQVTLDQLHHQLQAPRRFSGFKTSFFTLDQVAALCVFGGSPKDPGQLRSITLSGNPPGLGLRPEDDDCPTCCDLLVRTASADDRLGLVDVSATLKRLRSAVDAGAVREDPAWVRLADLQPLHASGLMDRVEAQLRCTSCDRFICFTLIVDAAPEFGYFTLDAARRHLLAAIPPVAQWGDADRIVAEANAMQYVAHEPGRWFLVKQGDNYFLDARYIITSHADDSALIRLNEGEVERYRSGGHEYLHGLAHKIHDRGPGKPDSEFTGRDLYREPGGAELRGQVSAAIVNHTWLAEQRQRPSPN